MKSLYSLIVLFVYTVACSFGLYKIKVADSMMTSDFVIGAFCYGLSFAIWMILVRMLPLSLAFPIATGIIIISTQIIGFYFLHEPIGAVHLTGIALVLAGVGILFVQSG